MDYIGSESHMGAMVLRMLGYDASSLRWGMMAWTKDDTALGPYKRYGEAQQRDFKLVKK